MKNIKNGIFLEHKTIFGRLLSFSLFPEESIAGYKYFGSLNK